MQSIKVGNKWHSYMYPCNYLVAFQRRLNPKIRKNVYSFLSGLGRSSSRVDFMQAICYSQLPFAVDFEKIRGWTELAGLGSLGRGSAVS